MGGGWWATTRCHTIIMYVFDLDAPSILKIIADSA
jgi:hypothetical protein